ncbi:amidohydrolase family protein [Pseudohaliea rubra]|uniref:Dihydroorotase n=1 Tax=Pseudohaliea rubra DSM 19751 TaxID=1265313 RepID=A0A095X0G9_9GAMM|nr:amidohydrolase family protein [Pseudohaliea rubra]KGE04394.1 Dihydroorotase [Pseudohaliea rubra DSM 19751]
MTHYLGTALLTLALALPAAAHDLVLRGGRVMDPETGLDAVRDVGIDGDRITVISDIPLRGDRVINATGKVVAPGFIDAHLHGVTPIAHKLALRDGLTSAMDLEFGTLGTRVNDWYAERAGSTQVNYGTASSHELARSLILDGIEAKDVTEAQRSRGQGTRWADGVPTDKEFAAIMATIDAGLAAGALGLGSTVGYLPGASARELYEAQKVAAAYGRLSAVHTRHTPGTATTTPNGIQEMLANAVSLGAPAIVMHFNNPGWELVQDLLVGLRREGHNIWGEIYPYAAGSTTLNAAFFRPEIYEDQLGKRYEDTLFDPATQTFYTKERYLELVAKEPARPVISYKMPPEQIPDWLRMDGITMGSDGMPIDGRHGWGTPFEALPAMHPRGAGARGRTLRLAREHDIPLMHVLAALSYRTAKHLGDTGLAAMRERGRLQEGMVADIVVFDPETVTDNATYAASTRPTTGIETVLVGGRVTVDGGRVREDVFAGKPLRFTPQVPD